eukprot:UN2466
MTSSRAILSSGPEALHLCCKGVHGLRKPAHLSAVGRASLSNGGRGPEGQDSRCERDELRCIGGALLHDEHDSLRDRSHQASKCFH